MVIVRSHILNVFILCSKVLVLSDIDGLTASENSTPSAFQLSYNFKNVQTSYLGYKQTIK